MTVSRREKRRPKLYQRKSLLIAFALTVLLIILVYADLSAIQSNLDQGKTLKAAIIDQLNSSHSNNTFWLTANSMFQSNGWSLHYYSGSLSSADVTFYRSLPQRAFNIVIIRSHTAMEYSTGTLAIFTSEQWDDEKASTTYLTDAMNDRIARVRVTLNSTAYFGITSNFVKAMNGNFQDSIIIMMGCESLTNTKMAEAFIEKGAKAYIGWTGLVSADHTDAATQQLLKHLIVEKKTMATAITETLTEVGKDPTYESTMSYYPSQAGEYRP